MHRVKPIKQRPKNKRVKCLLHTHQNQPELKENVMYVHIMLEDDSMIFDIKEEGGVYPLVDK